MKKGRDVANERCGSRLRQKFIARGRLPERQNGMGISFWETKQQSNRRGPKSENLAPPESTNAENDYYLKQKDAGAVMIVKLMSGQEISGIIEWYDRNCVKVVQGNGLGVVILKHEIKYIYKQNDG